MRYDVIHKDDDAYPEALRTIGEPPNELFFSGDISLLKRRCVAIVGSRKTSEYGRRIASELAGKLSAAGVTVVSGMAAGIDTAAQKSALKHKSTIAVLGCGIDNCYPAANRQLKKDIEKTSLVISEYPPGTPITKWMFPKRNRIISGLAEATVVISAGINSGALITAGHAAEQGRALYAVPANINDVCSLGSNMLIRDGAMPLVVLDDLLHDLGINGAAKEDSSMTMVGDEKKIYDALSGGGEMSIDELMKTTGMPPSRLNGTVTVMEMKGIVWTALGKIFLAN